MKDSSPVRFRRLTIILTGCLLLPYSADALQEVRAAPLHVRVIWYDPGELLPGSFGWVADEVGSIFETLGVEVDLEETKADTVTRMPGQFLAVLLSRGPEGWREDSHVLRAVRLTQRNNIRVYYETIRYILGFSDDGVNRMLPGRERILVARALGRVLAHELIHAVADPHPHAKSGVFHHRLSKKQLMQRTVVIDSACSTAFVDALRAQPTLANR